MERYAEYKDSGVEWIRRIPLDWNVVRFKTICRFEKGLSITKADLVEKGIPVVSYGQIHSKHNNGVHISEELTCYVEDCYLKDNTKALVNYGDIIFADTSEDYEGIGNCIFVDNYNVMFAGYHTVISRPQKVKNSKYLAYLFQDDDWRRQVRSRVMGIKVFSLTQKILKDVTLLIPPEIEQESIVKYLDHHVSHIESLILDLNKQSEMIEVYKCELIVNCITKGIDKSTPMKDCGVDWIGDVPTHWQVVPLFSVATENKVKNTGMICDNLLSLSYGNIIRKDIGTSFGLLPESFEGYQIVDEGYTVMRLTDLQNDQRSLRTGYVREKGIITSAYLSLKPNECINGEFFRYVLHTYDLIKVYYGLGGGLRQSLKFGDVKRLPVLIPPIEEQIEITEYLDKKVEQIDSLLADISAQIEKLKEYRKIVIHDAVTGQIKITED